MIHACLTTTAMAHSKIYVDIMNSRAWRETRAKVIREHPLCELCLQQGIYTPARCVHHIVPVESATDEQSMWMRALDAANCQALCFQHHADIHRGEGSQTRDAHHEREKERLQAWVARMEELRRKCEQRLKDDNT